MELPSNSKSRCDASVAGMTFVDTRLIFLLSKLLGLGDQIIGVCKRALKAKNVL